MHGSPGNVSFVLLIKFPQAYHAIISSRRNPFAIGAEANATNALRVFGKSLYQFAGYGIPHFYVSAQVACHNPAVVRIPRDSLQGVFVPFNRSQQLEVFGIPNFDGLVPWRNWRSVCRRDRI